MMSKIKNLFGDTQHMDNETRGDEHSAIAHRGYVEHELLVAVNGLLQELIAESEGQVTRTEAIKVFTDLAFDNYQEDCNDLDQLPF
jgi:RNA-binding protein YhbY